jgi:hypothetical protein
LPERLEAQWAMDNYSVSYHGLAHTHMDSLCHLFFRGRMYNDFSREEVRESGAARLSIDNVKTGIFTRGLLVDVPRLRGVKYLNPGAPIYPADLEKWEKVTGLTVKPGDVVFIRTGAAGPAAPTEVRGIRRLTACPVCTPRARSG